MSRIFRSKNFLSLMAVMLLCGTIAVALTALSSLHAHAAASAPPLGTAASFAVLGATTVTNTGPTILGGNLGVSPGSACTGFPSPCTGGPGTVTGTIHVADAVAAQAQTDATGAYLFATAQACMTTFPPITDIGGMTLTPGVYCFPSSAGITGTLTLDARGDPNAVFIFKIGSTLITASASKVVLINGAQPSNVFWQVGSSATLGTTTSFAGSIVALTSITATAGVASDCGLYALNGAVTFDSTLIETCSPPGAAVFSIQTLNACRQAIGGATFNLTGNGLDETKTAAEGGPTPVASGGNCPIQQGNCVQVPTGCVSFDIPIPASGTRTYTVTETAAPAGYVPCRSRTCPAGPEIITLTVSSSGKIAATTYNPNTRKIYPTNRSSFTGAETDPALVYNFKASGPTRGK